MIPPKGSGEVSELTRSMRMLIAERMKASWKSCGALSGRLCVSLKGPTQGSQALALIRDNARMMLDEMEEAHAAYALTGFALPAYSMRSQARDLRDALSSGSAGDAIIALTELRATLWGILDMINYWKET